MSNGYSSCLVWSCYVLSCPSDFAPVSLAWHRQQRGIQKYLRTCFIIKRPDSFFPLPSFHLSKQHCFIACFIAMRCCYLFIPFYSVQPAWMQFRLTLSVTPSPPPPPPPPHSPPFHQLQQYIAHFFIWSALFG